RGLNGLGTDAVLIPALVRALLLRMRVGEAEDRILGQGGCGVRTECERAEDGNAERPSRRRSAHWDLPCSLSGRSYPAYAEGTTQLSSAALQLTMRAPRAVLHAGLARRQRRLALCVIDGRGDLARIGDPDEAELAVVGAGGVEVDRADAQEPVAEPLVGVD